MTSTSIKPDHTKPKHEKKKQWAWFVGIWTASLLVTMSIGYVIKILIKAI